MSPCFLERIFLRKLDACRKDWSAVGVGSAVMDEDGYGELKGVFIDLQSVLLAAATFCEKMDGGSLSYSRSAIIIGPLLRGD